MVAGLIRNRHALPPHVKDFVWDYDMTTDEILDVDWQERHCIGWLRQNLQDGEYLNLYVTGLTQALVSMINACHQLDVPLTLWHYDRSSRDYYKQVVR